ncbi:hypothetical protein [Agromyces seonyuensis]|uniref:Uncharacterized protein n=1 Tax=Agromyces seonyuensis TaxID=2662446 RepID=A0A6I4NYC4_9MICO|nr:hypothetical protein [Agromyces seonyuensis]MWB99316.1 hypothetical protein [Agromyces seonyuensis]
MANAPDPDESRFPLFAATLWIVAIAVLVLLAVFSFTGADSVAEGGAAFGRGLLWLLPVILAVLVVIAIRTDLARKLGLRRDPWDTDAG